MDRSNLSLVYSLELKLISVIATDEDRFITTKMVVSLLSELTYFLFTYLLVFHKVPINLRSQISEPIKHPSRQMQALAIPEQSDAQPNLFLNRNHCSCQFSFVQQAL